MRWITFLMLLFALAAPVCLTGCGNAQMSQEEAADADDGSLDAPDAPPAEPDPATANTDPNEI